MIRYLIIRCCISSFFGGCIGIYYAINKKRNYDYELIFTLPYYTLTGALIGNFFPYICHILSKIKLNNFIFIHSFLMIKKKKE